jgi:hypothetical protein
MDPDSGGPKTCGSGPQHWMFFLYILATRGRKARRKRDEKKKREKILSLMVAFFLSVRHYFVFWVQLTIRLQILLICHERMCSCPSVPTRFLTWSELQCGSVNRLDCVCTPPPQHPPRPLFTLCGM